MNNIKTCIITGCAGFIGSHLTETCLKMGWYVYGIDKLSFCSYPLLMEEFKQKYPKQFKFEHNDINNVKHIPDDIDILFNICAESHVQNSIENSNEFLKSNINGVHNLLELIRHKKNRPLFYQMSTDEVYGDAENGKSHTEADIYNPSNPYSFSKAAADLLIKSYSRTYGIKFKIGRPTNTWGIRQNSEKLIPKTCKLLRLNKKIPLHNYGKPKRTWLHVEDCVSGILKIINDGEINEIYNIPGNVEIHNYEIVAKIANLIGLENNYYIKIKPNPIHFEKIKIDNNSQEHTALIKSYSNGTEYIQRIDEFTELNTNMDNICDFSYHRDGQDFRYSLDGNKLYNLKDGINKKWTNIKNFDNSLVKVVQYYNENFIW